ncbi:MAG: HEAT repeat domain-containing protein, partial [Lentisphaerae bacterium]
MSNLRYRPLTLSIVYLTVIGTILGIAPLSATELPQSPKITPPDNRKLYHELSDSEFASLNPGPVLYPLVVPEFLQRPIKGEFLERPTPRYGRDRDIELQKEIFSTFRNPFFKANAVTELVRTHNPKVREILTGILPSMADPKNTATILLGLTNLKASIDKQTLTPYINHQHPAVKLAAARLWSIQPWADGAPLLSEANLKSPFAAEFIHLAGRCAKNTNLQFWQKLLAERKVEFADEILETLSRTPNALPSPQVLKQLISLPQPDWAVALAKILHRLPNFAEIAGRLASHPNAIVRARLAQAIGTHKMTSCQTVLLKLMADKNYNVRRIAIKNSSFFANRPLFDALIPNLRVATSHLLWEAALERLTALAARVPAEEWVSPLLTDSSEYLRQAICQFLIDIQSRRYPRQLEALARREKRPENVAVAMTAAAIAGVQFADWIAA